MDGSTTLSISLTKKLRLEVASWTADSGTFLNGAALKRNSLKKTKTRDPLNILLWVSDTVSFGSTGPRGQRSDVGFQTTIAKKNTSDICWLSIDKQACLLWRCMCAIAFCGVSFGTTFCFYHFGACHRAQKWSTSKRAAHKPTCRLCKNVFMLTIESEGCEEHPFGAGLCENHCIFIRSKNPTVMILSASGGFLFGQHRNFRTILVCQQWNRGVWDHC